MFQGFAHFDVKDLLRSVVNVEFCKTGGLLTVVIQRRAMSTPGISECATAISE